MTTTPPKVVCLCPTYGRPKLVMNAYACFLAQDYPVDRRQLFVLDDFGNFHRTVRDGLLCETTTTRFKSITEKYNWMCEQSDADIVVIWDDDDIYLPMHISSHVRALKASIWSQPAYVYSEYEGNPVRLEGSDGRFHGSIAFDLKEAKRLWGREIWDETPKREFDQMFINKLNAVMPRAVTGRYDYVFRWDRTKHAHAQYAMTDAQKDTWYENYAPSDTSHHGVLLAQYDDDTREVFNFLGQPMFNGGSIGGDGRWATTTTSQPN